MLTAARRQLAGRQPLRRPHMLCWMPAKLVYLVRPCWKSRQANLWRRTRVNLGLSNQARVSLQPRCYPSNIWKVIYFFRLPAGAATPLLPSNFLKFIFKKIGEREVYSRKRCALTQTRPPPTPYRPSPSISSSGARSAAKALRKRFSLVCSAAFSAVSLVKSVRSSAISSIWRWSFP